MDPIDFLNNYVSYLDEIAYVVKPEYQSIIEELKLIDPFDIVEPETWFNTLTDARGFVWNLFFKEIKFPQHK